MLLDGHLPFGRGEGGGVGGIVDLEGEARRSVCLLPFPSFTHHQRSLILRDKSGQRVRTFPHGQVTRSRSNGDAMRCQAKQS